jgi:hypothetical protein
MVAGDVRDPLKRDLIKADEEQSAMGLASSADRLPLGRSTFDTRVGAALGKTHLT